MISGLSIVICCFNSSQRLSLTLKHIAFQEVSTKTKWEIIVVDNASTDNTEEIAIQEWSKYNLNIPFRIVKQPKPGLSYAREKGISEALYEYVLFCDDDNWLDKSYLTNAIARLNSDPEISILSGWCDGEFEETPKKWMDGLFPALAIGKPHPHSGYVENPIYGAGMILNKKILLNLKDKGFTSLLSDRKGALLTSGGDSEICYVYLLAREKIFFDERLYFKHFMPSERLRKTYFLKLCLSNISPLFPLEIYAYFIKNKKANFINYMANSIKNKTFNLFYFLPRVFIGKYKFYSMIQFIQSVKYVLLSFIKINYIYKSFNKVKTLQLKIKSND